MLAGAAKAADRVVDGGGRALRRLQAKLREVKSRANALREKVAQLVDENKKLREENKKLLVELAKRERRGKRQAAPFSKDNRKKNPKKPGRKTGKEHGPRGQRPAPDKVDQTLEAELPACCPDCGGGLREEFIRDQFQTDIPPVVPVTTQFRIHVGCCLECGKKVRGRHPQQSSDAVGAAAHQIGPKALATASHLHTVLGLPYGKITDLFQRFFGLEVVPSTLVRAQTRLGSLVEPTYEELKLALRQAAVVYPDETGWRIDAVPAWLWAFVSDLCTVYAIEKSRGQDVIDSILGLDYSGTVGHDGWSSYNALKDATHQTCLEHLLRRCERLLEVATRGAVRFPRAVKSLLQDALTLRERRDGGLITPHGLLCLLGKLEARKAEILQWSPTYEPNRLLRDHLERVRDQLFTFLRIEGVEATNWPAEQAIRPAVVNRKVCGGNRSETGAAALARLMTIFRTASQQGRDAIDFIVELMRTPAGQQLPSLLPGP